MKPTRLPYLHTAMALAASGLVLPIENQLDATYNDTLTTFAVGLAKVAKERSLLNFIAPLVNTQGADSGKYKSFNNADALRTYSLAVSKGKRETIGFDSTDLSYALNPIGLQVVITEREMKQKGNVAQIMVGQMVNSFLLSREKNGLATLRSLVTATGGLGAWLTDDTVDPINQLDGEIVRISDNTGGFMPNRLVLPLALWKRIRNHPLVKARVVGLSGEVSLDQLKGMLINPAIDIRLGTLSYETSAKGKTAAKASVYGSDIWLFYASETVDAMDISFCKNFAESDTVITAVRSYIEDGNNEIHYIDTAEQILCTAPIAGSRITVS